MMGLFRLFSPKVLRSIIHHDPCIEGHFKLEMFDERGKRRGIREGKNICTLTGREHIAELLALSLRTPRTTYREDRISFLGVGTGAQPEVSNVTSLIEPVPYKTGEFLAPVLTPATFPTGDSTTAVQFVREFGKNEISLGYNVVVTEAGLFTDGDPDNNFDISATPTDYATASARAPMFYKTFEPITKTTQFSLRAIWEVRVV
jgi:hypothetical protein